MGLDENDLIILNVLQANGRLSYRQISEKVKMSVPTVSSKIGNLERMGVISGYHARLDPERMGEFSAMVTIKARPSELSVVTRHFNTDDQVRQMFLLTGGRLLLICTYADIRAINEFASRLASIPQILDYDIANVIGVAKELHRAVVTSGEPPIPICANCGLEVRGEPLRLKDGRSSHFLCSDSCLSALRGRLGKC